MLIILGADVFAGQTIGLKQSYTLRYMTILSKTLACLRVISDDLVPSEISKLLGCEPTLQMTKGEPYFWKRDGVPRIARSGMWRLEAKDQIPGDLDLQVDCLLNLLSDDLKVWKSLCERYSVDMSFALFMESGMEGISLSAKSMLALGMRGIEIDFDMYGPNSP